MATSEIKTMPAARPSIYPRWAGARWVVVVSTLVGLLAFGVLYAWATASV